MLVTLKFLLSYSQVLNYSELLKKVMYGVIQNLCLR